MARLIDGNAHRWGAAISAVVLLVAFAANWPPILPIMAVVLAVVHSFGLRFSPNPSGLLVEFYGEDCAPCVVVERQLAKLAAEIPDVAVVRIDAGARLDLADRYNVRRIPTLFVADGDLRIIWRASGVPGVD